MCRRATAKTDSGTTGPCIWVFLRAAGSSFAAEPHGFLVALFDLRPIRAERQRYHGEQADLAAKEQKWFAVAFHVGRLLLDDPANADLKKRREEAVRKHASR